MVNPETWKPFLTLAALEIVCLSINPGTDGRREKVREMPDDTSSFVAWAGNQQRSSIAALTISTTTSPN